MVLVIVLYDKEKNGKLPDNCVVYFINLTYTKHGCCHHYRRLPYSLEIISVSLQIAIDLIILTLNIINHTAMLQVIDIIRQSIQIFLTSFGLFRRFQTHIDGKCIKCIWTSEMISLYKRMSL